MKMKIHSRYLILFMLKAYDPVRIGKIRVQHRPAPFNKVIKNHIIIKICNLNAFIIHYNELK